MTIGISVGVAAILMNAAAWAADTTPLDVKTGEWETTMTGETSGQMPFPQEMLDKMTPEQRARMEQTIKARGAEAAKPTVRKSCIRKEQLDKPFGGGQDAKTCKQTIVTSSRTKQEIRMECENAGAKQSGTFRVEATDSSNAKGSMQMSVSNGRRTMNMNYNFSAKWLGPVCTEASK